jgi:hypothetical protein
VVASGCDGVFGLTTVHADDDAADAAPCPNAIGHDEDRDTLDDSCDPCPFDPNNDGDADGDGIALACDPDPAAMNPRLLFTGFGGVGPSVELRSLATLENDAVVTTLDGMAPNSYIFWSGVQSDKVWVQMGVDVAMTLPSATYRQVGFVFDAVDAGNSDPNGTLCILGKRTTDVPNDHLSIYERMPPASDVSLQDAQAPWPVDNWHGVIRASYDRNGSPQVYCEFRSADSTLATIMATRSPLPAPGKLGVFIDDSTVTVRWLFVIGKP